MIVSGKSGRGTGPSYGPAQTERTGYAGGHKWVVPRARQQLALGIQGAHPPNDQAILTELGPRDLRLARVGGVGQGPPSALGDRFDRRANVGLDGHPDRVAPAGAWEP